jgi:hypothetical protein
MASVSLQEFTQLLQAWSRGDSSALQKLTALIYKGLHSLAHHYLGYENSGLNLQTGALVNEAYHRLVSKWLRMLCREFNTAAFGRPPQGYYGDTPVLPVRSPEINNWDLALMKQFKLWSEASSLQFRSEFYNAFNHSQFSYVDTNVWFDQTGQQVNSTFGQINGARSARVIQLSLRLQF